MIYKFAISNFRSIGGTLELDFRIPGTTPRLPNFRAIPSTPAMRLPAVIALFGANGAGKTNILRTITHTLRFVLYSHEHRASAVLQPFLSQKGLASPTRIEISFAAAHFVDEAEDRVGLYRYELELTRSPADPSATRVVHEAMFSFPLGRPRRIFERKDGERIYITPEADITNEDRAVKALRPEASLIATLAASYAPMFVCMHKNLSMIYSPPESWRPGKEITIENYAGDDNLAFAVSRQLQRIDVGIESMKVQDLPGGGRELAFAHRGLIAPLTMPLESAGTRNLVTHFPYLSRALETGHVALLDALDSEFHADLAAEIIRWFQSPETNPHGAQLLCTLHNLAVLESLEKEEVVIVEKNGDGVSSAYGLWQVRGLRRSANLYREYRSGDLGGLPVIG